MRAVVMAGGEGTRLRPLTTSYPKPLLPIVDRPMLHHVLTHLGRHGITESVVTVQFMAGLIRSYFGDGDEFGMRLDYTTDDRPLGTAGSVHRAAGQLGDETFVVISGDAITDIDLTALVAFHRSRGALATVALAHKPDPVEFGITITDESGRIVRFLEKPSWGQVFSDTVNTGIYVFEPEILASIPAGTQADWSGDIFPALLAKGAPVFGFVADGYWEDVGSLTSYLGVQRDVLDGLVKVDIGGFQVAPGVWVAEGAEIDPEVSMSGPAFVGPYARIEAHAHVGEHTVIGANVVVRGGARLQRSVVHDNAFIGPGADLRGCVIGKNTDVMRGARVEDGAVVAEQSTIGEEAIVSAGVKVYPGKTVAAGAMVRESVFWDSDAHHQVLGPRGLSGIVNVEVTPESAVRLAAGLATTLPKGSTVTLGRDHGRASRALARAVGAGLTAAAVTVRDLEAAPIPLVRHDVRRQSAAGIFVRTTPGVSESADIVVLDGDGRDQGPVDALRLERVLSRGDFRRAFPGEIGDIVYPARAYDDYVFTVLDRVDISGVIDAGLRIVVDSAGGAASLMLPRLLSRVGVHVHAVNTRIDESVPTETQVGRGEALKRLGKLVASSRADFGVRFDPTGERLSIVDETGHVIPSGRALLVMVDLVAAERQGGVVAIPVTTTRIVEQVAAFHGVRVAWTKRSDDDLAAFAESNELILAGDGRRGFVIPEVGPTIDGLAAFVRLTGLVARTKLSLSTINARIPNAHVVRLDVPTPWARKGAVMRGIVESAPADQIDTTDGVRIVSSDGAWCLVLPDPEVARTRLWAEGSSPERAQEILGQWATTVRELAAVSSE